MKKSAVWVLKIDIFFDFSIVLRLKGGIFVAQKTRYFMDWKEILRR
jgi:hypothetical protein